MVRDKLCRHLIGPVRIHLLHSTVKQGGLPGSCPCCRSSAISSKRQPGPTPNHIFITTTQPPLSCRFSKRQPVSYLWNYPIATMRLLKILVLFPAIFHAASAFRSQDKDMDDFLKETMLPECTRNCKSVSTAASWCSVMPFWNSEGSAEPWVHCFCSQEGLRSQSNARTICRNACTREEETLIERWYMHLCSLEEEQLPGLSSSVPAPTSTRVVQSSLVATLTYSTHYTSTASATTLVPVSIVTSNDRDPQEEHRSTESW